jgi:hypothetical protein
MIAGKTCGFIAHAKAIAPECMVVTVSFINRQAFAVKTIPNALKTELDDVCEDSKFCKIKNIKFRKFQE